MGKCEKYKIFWSKTNTSCLITTSNSFYNYNTYLVPYQFFMLSNDLKLSILCKTKIQMYKKSYIG